MTCKYLNTHEINCVLQKNMVFSNYNYIYYYPLAELNQRMLNPSYRFSIY